jgi:hypothetical protein
MAGDGIPEEVKAFMVTELACYSTPSEVAEAVLQEFGLTIDRRAVERYNPTRVTGANLGKKHRDLFFATREEFKQQAIEVPIANRVFRLRLLDRAVRLMLQRKNVMGAAQLIEQAAKETGGVFDRRPIGSGGAGRGAHARGAGDNSPEAMAAADAKLREFLKGGKVKAKR